VQEVVTAFVSELLAYLNQKLRVRALPEHVIALDSGTPLKFSHHLHLRLPDEAAWSSNAECGNFMRAFVELLLVRYDGAHAAVASSSGS
jgi:hypothetical protein